MLRRFILILGICLAQSFCWAQSDIVQLEYYVDEDPGVGEATEIPMSQGQNIDINYSIPVSSMSLSQGWHTVVVRAKNADGFWSLYESRRFYIQSVAGASDPVIEDIDEVEYYVNEDPGVGHGIKISISSGQTLDFEDVVNTSEAKSGLNVVGIRAKNAAGLWGFTEVRSFYLQDADPIENSPPGDIVLLEYFFDKDPGHGRAAEISVTQGQMVDVSEIFEADTLSVGLHKVGIRAKNEYGIWGLTEYRSVYVQSVGSVTTTPVLIKAMEYFIDEDPGVGKATPIDIASGVSEIDIDNITLSTNGPLTIGDHSLTIRAQNMNGSWGYSETKTFSVDGDCPIASFDVSLACAGESIFLTDNSSGILGEADYTWFADGDSISNTEGDIAHIFEDEGTHTLSLKIKNGEICQDSTGIEVYIKDKPIAIFSAQTVTLGDTTHFEVDTFNIGPTSTWSWDFDSDDNVDTSVIGNLKYVFTTSGTFITKLTVSDGSGCENTYNRSVKVLDSATTTSVNTPIEDAEMAFSYSGTCINSSTTFINGSLNVPDSAIYNWDFNNDGIVDSNSENPSHQFDTAGSYTVSLWIETDTIYSFASNVKITPKPIARFEVTGSCIGEAATIQNYSVAPSASFKWDMDGDGVTDSEDPGLSAFTYEQPDDYTASLLLDYGNGCLDFEAITINVSEPPQAGFSYSYELAGSAASVQFYNESINGKDYIWSFGDGDSSMVQSPSHEFGTDETYTVCLTTRNGCSEEQFCQEMNFSVLGVNDLEADISIYPNPSDGQVYLEIFNSTQAYHNIELFDFNGKEIYKREFTGGKLKRLELPYLRKGSYLVVISNESGQYRKTLFVGK